MSSMLIFACSSHEQKGKDKNDRIAVDSVKIITDTNTPAISLPVWAKELGLSVPQNMQLIAKKSHLTSVIEPSEGFNSITLVYSGNYETAMKQSSRIARGAKLPLSKEYKARKKLAKRAGHGNIVKGIAYMNYDLSTRDIDFLTYVTVDENGVLTISTTNMKQMNLQLSKHAEVTKRKSK